MAIQAKHIMRERIAVRAETSLKDAADRIIATGLPGLPVINERQEVQGIITEFNILGAIREGIDVAKTPVARIMSKEPTTADLDATTDNLIQLMLIDNFTIMPIVNKNRYVGLVSRNMIMDACLSPNVYAFADRGNENS